MQPKAHLFVVDDDTMPIHIQKGFCGIVKINPKNSAGRINSSYYAQLADCMNIKKDDLVYFYMQTKEKRKFFDFKYKDKFDDLEQGYYGVYKVIGKPFYHTEEIIGAYPFENYYIFGADDNAHYKSFTKTITTTNGNSTFSPPILHIKIPIKPVKNYSIDFENRFVDDNQAYIDKEDESMLSTLMFKKIGRQGEARSITPILPEEASKIARLLFKQKRRRFPLNIDNDGLLRNSDPSKDLKARIFSNDGEILSSESMLELYILDYLNEHKDLGYLGQIIGNYDEIEFCGNQIQYGISGNKVDILLLHKKVLAGSTSYRYKATVIELKKDAINSKNISQIIDYQKWIAQLTTYNNLKVIKPILIGKKPSTRMTSASKLAIKEALKAVTQIGISAPEFIEYLPTINNKNEVISIDFKRFDINALIN